MSGGSTSGRPIPSNDGLGPESVSFTATDDAERLLGINDETTTVAVRAMPGNGGIIYVGFTDEVDSSDGFPLSAGDSITLEVDASQQGVFAAAGSVGDEVRWIALA